MGLTHFPYGISTPLIVGAGPINTTGNVYFVSSTSSGRADSADHGTPTSPFATLAYAVARTTASQGDVIYVMPGHDETITAAGGITLSKAGVTIVGLGPRGGRPIIRFGGTAATFIVSGADCTIQNLRCTASVDEVVVCFKIQAARCTLDAVDFFETATFQAISFALLTSTHTIIQNCDHQQNTAPAANGKWIELTAADRAMIRFNTFQLTTTSNSASNVIGGTTTASVNILIDSNTIVQLGGTAVVPISLLAGTSGYARQNYVASTKTAVAGSIALASCYGAENYASNTVNVQGFLEPVVDT